MFRLTFKTPDVISQNKDLSDEEIKFAEKFIQFNEYIVVEFEPIFETATVLKINLTRS